jgi:3-(3-hydroxy-phenyl)propionate hydroxylase
MTMFDDDVIVAGAGPVGLSAALALAKSGVRVRVLEAGAELSTEARASTLHPPTLELFERWGVLDRVVARGLRIDRLQFWERATRERVAEFPYALIAGDTSCPFRLQCPQSTVTRILEPALEAEGGRLELGHEVTGFADRGDHVEVFAATAQGPRTFRARWLVGADGSKSRVRTALGLGFSGMTYPDRFLLVATDLEVDQFFPGMGPVSYVFDPDEWVIVMRLPDVVRIVFRLDPHGPSDDEAKDETSVRARIATFLGQRVEHGIASISTYSVHQRVADRFRVGRVLLAGDAAHVNNPAGGMGMNSGIHDAAHLARALVVERRQGSDAALDAYAAERRRVAVDGVQRGSDKNYRDLIAREEGERAARNRELREAAADPKKARAWLLRLSMLPERVATGVGQTSASAEV